MKDHPSSSATALLLPVLVAVLPACKTQETALDVYVKKEDPTYSWKLLWSHVGAGFTTHLIDLTSQTWRQPDEVDRTVWQHWLTVVEPDEVKQDTALLFIGGGSNGREPPDEADSKLARIAVGTGTVVAELRMIPNQPLTFIGDDNRPRKEDDLIAHTWNKFMDTGDPTWLARFPMVKSAVRAMDTIQALPGQTGSKPRVEKFVVAGGSKRGWTTWLTAAVDSRVTAIVPIVIDVLNVKISMEHHLAAYGFWAPAVGDYERNGIMERRTDPQYVELLRLVDPYAYRDRFTMPKLMINSTGDQFFLPDSSQFYFDDLPGEKHLRYVPNTDHGLGDSDAAETLHAFYLAVLTGKPRPEFSWSLEADGAIRVTTQTPPKEVKLWQASNPSERDFRLRTIGRAWKSSPLSPTEEGVYVASVPKPPSGWTAFFVELTFDGDPPPLKLTTEVRVVPDALPFVEKLKSTSLAGN